MGTMDILEHDKYKVDSIWDDYQDYFTTIIKHYSFPWTFLIFVIVGFKKWRSPVMLIIIFHFILRYIGIIFENTGDVMENKYPGYDYSYHSNEAYKWSHAISRIIYYSSDIVGDWYLLFRTKALVKSNKKIIMVYITCILFNCSKLAKIYFNFSYTPFKENFDPELDRYDYYSKKIEYKKKKWTCDFFLHIASIIYDLTVIITLKRNVFINYENITEKNERENIFIKKFQQISTYRIYWTLLLSIICSPLVFLFCTKLVYTYHNLDFLQDQEKINFYKEHCDDSDIEKFRVSINHTGYVLMYIDQILLRYYAIENKKINGTNPKKNYNMIKYHNYYNINNNDNDYNNNNYNNDYNDNNDNNSNSHNKNKNKNKSHSHSHSNSNSRSIKFYRSNSIKKYNFSKVYHDINNQFDEYQNLINYNNNDYMGFKSKSLDRYDKENSTKNYYNKFDSANRYSRNKTNYFDLKSKTNNNTNNNNNHISVDYYNSNNRTGWETYYNSLSRNTTTTTNNNN
ncbi:hypothetical protein BCR32DRAFT_284269 [Anaeromyces robustus]|uniref:Uncharacterized protein n=1 Tax=Anaeromyces robustus TaxID=1754192 RepID=A0A1Y1WS30_9FUNG|nr:hypothetical protein BCR32DRAFT_284269 [Anaeromyces robustus]|eukprot:ORX76349.1 hypothetical protein BCR32DRAFT_284269 [Anaeromyces robustus]